MAERVQLSRKAGWRIPDNTVNVARPTKWGNPVSVTEVGGSPQVACTMYRDWLNGAPNRTRAPPTRAEIVSELRGKNLACWCSLKEPCHADILLEIANRPNETIVPSHNAGEGKS